MLEALSGRCHEVLTGICLRRGSDRVCDFARTRVWFTAMTAPEIDAYVASGEPMDKAGGYAIQGLASKFIERIDGCYFNVVGLPLVLLADLLHRLELDRLALGLDRPDVGQLAVLDQRLDLAYLVLAHRPQV